MKTRFLKYCLSIATLLFVAFTCFPNNTQSFQFGKENTQADSSYLHPEKKVASQRDLKKAKENTFHKENLQHTFVSHYKGNFTEIQFEVQNTLTLKKAKALFRFEVLRFAQILLGKDFNEQHTVRFKYSRFNSFLHSALYIRLQVMRL